MTVMLTPAGSSAPLSAWGLGFKGLGLQVVFMAEGIRFRAFHIKSPKFLSTCQGVLCNLFEDSSVLDSVGWWVNGGRPEIQNRTWVLQHLPFKF